jgi:hypothetical protein
MTDYVNAYAIPALKIRGSDYDSPQPTLDSFLFATDQYDYRKKSPKARATVVRKYQTNIAAAVRKLLGAKKRSKAVISLMETFPDAIESLENSDAILLDEFLLVARSILKNPVQIAIFEKGVLRGPIEREEGTPILLLTLDTAKGRPALLYGDGEVPTYIFPNDHPTIELLRNLDNIIGAEKAASPSDPPKEETAEDILEAQIYHLDDLQFDPFEEELEMDRALPPPPAEMERTHLLADMIKLLPDNPDIESYTKTLLHSLAKPPAAPRFLKPYRPLVRIDPMAAIHPDQNEAMKEARIISTEHIERMKDFAKATRSSRPYVQSVYTQDQTIEGASLFDKFEASDRRDVVLDDFDFSIRDDNWMKMIDVEYCHQKIDREVLEKYARVYNVKLVGNKRRLCELMEPYLATIVKKISNEDSCDKKMTPEDESQMPLLEESDGHVLAYHTTGLLKEEGIRSQGLLYEGDQATPYDVIRFDIDRYKEHLQRISNALPVRCELKHFAKEGSFAPPLSEEGEAMELVDDTFLRVRTDSDRETFFNIRNIEANTFFLYTVSYEGARFHKKDLGDRNVIFRSAKMTPEEIRHAMGLSFEQYMYIRRKGGFVDTPLQHDFDTTAGISRALRELFDVEGIDQLTRAHFEELRKEIESADLSPVPKARKKMVMDRTGLSFRSYPFIGKEVTDQMRERPVLTTDPTVQERLGALVAHHDYPQQLSRWVQSSDLLRGPPPEYTIPAFETPRMDPPGTILNFESMEAMRAHRLELEPVLQHRAEMDLRKNAQAVRSSYSSLEEIHATQIELMKQIYLFGRLSRRSKISEMQADHTRRIHLVGDLKEADVFTTAGDEQIQYVAPMVRTKAPDQITMTDTLVDLFRIPMNETDRRRIEADQGGYKTLLSSLFAAQKGTRPGAPSARLEEYTDVCARCSLIAIYLMGRRELFPLNPRHANHFSFEGFPVSNIPNGVAKYLAHVLGEAYQSNPMFNKPESVEKTIRAAMSYFIRKYPSVLPMLKRLSAEARERARSLRAEPLYKPLPRSSIVERVKKETKEGVLNKDFRMHPKTRSSQKRGFAYPSLVSAPTMWDRHVPVPREKRLRHKRTTPLVAKQAPTEPSSNEEGLDKELTELIEEVGDWADTQEFLRLAIRTPRNANFHRVNVNPEMNELGFSHSFDNPYAFLNSVSSRSVFEKHVVRNEASQGAAHNTLLMLRGTRDLLKALFEDDLPEGVSPFAMRHYIKNSSKQDAYNALQRAFAKGLRRLIQEIAFNTVDETKLREHSDLLRDADKQRALDRYADMDVDSRMVVKLVKDMVGIQPADPENNDLNDGEGDMAEENDFRFVPAEDDEQDD